MSSDPIDLTISRQTIPGQVDVVRIEARDGPRVLIQIDLPPSDFLSAVMGETVLAALNKGDG